MTPQQAVEQGFGLHQAGRLGEAESRYAEALALAPDFFPALHLMGVLRFHQRNLPEARNWLEKALGRDAGAAETRLHLGLVLAEMGESEAALDVLAQVVAVAPPNHPLAVAAHANRGDIL